MNVNPFILIKKPAWRYIVLGYDYQDYITDFKIHGNRVDANVKGTHLYQVSFFIDFKKMRIYGQQCSCPYHTETRSWNYTSGLIL